MRNLMWVALAAGGLLAGSSVLRAQDTIRLGGPSADIQAGTDLMRGGGGHGGGGHGGGWGHGGGYGHGGYGGYGRGYGYGGYGRGYGWGGYGRGYGWGGYGWGGWGWGGGYYPYYAGYYYPYYYPSYYYPTYYYPTYYYPIVGQSAPTLTLQGTSITLPGNYSQGPVGSPSGLTQPFSQPIVPPAGNGTFPYDGGPRSPIPMPAPGGDVPPSPRGIVPIDGKLVSFPAEAGGGFAPVGIPFARPSSKTSSQTQTSVPTTPAVPATPSVPRVSYPAYGDEPLPPAPRKPGR